MRDVEASLQSQELVTALKAAAEPTRLRILMLLAGEELNVKDLTKILGQSQPRISRHLKLLTEAGLIERFREGSWVYFFISDQTTGGQLARHLVQRVDTSDPVVSRDSDRAIALKRERETTAQRYFEEHASEWDRIRALHIAEKDVEQAMRDSLGTGPFDLLIDLGTGTGRTLELFSECYAQGLGIDVNHAMLTYARSKLAKAGLSHALVRHGDIYNLAVDDGVADAVVMHQVLHFLSQPQKAIQEAARVLAPGGKLLIVDFAPHDLEVLRDAQAHGRLGFPTHLVAQWIGDVGLQPQGNIQLKPDDLEDPEKLTVSVWLAGRPDAKQSNLEGDAPRFVEEAQS
ncbi:MAG: ArsR/SmtB family transcription factor [Hyphomicrobiaceae bacterium]